MNQDHPTGPRPLAVIQMHQAIPPLEPIKTNARPRSECVTADLVIFDFEPDRVALASS